MKHIILTIAFVGPFMACAQPFLVPCPAPDSVQAMYQDDADRLALSRTFRNGTTWVDSVAIDPDWSATAMYALLAVYNADLPERDTVVDLLSIHVYPSVTLRSVIVSADGALPWMQQLALGNLPTGTPSIDQLIADHGLTLANFYTWPGPSTGDHIAVFEAEAHSNVLALAAMFAAVQGVSYAEPNGNLGDGNTITDSVYADHVRVVYSFGWGDCPAGCTLRRYWEFSVYFDCSVVFSGSWGDNLVGTTDVPQLQLPVVCLYPNPVDDVLHIQLPPGYGNGGEWEVRDATGRIIMSGRLEGNGIRVPLDGVSRGTFLFALHTSQGLITKLFIKE